MRVIVVTSSTAKSMIEEVVARSRAVREGRVEAEVLALPVPVIGVLDSRAVAALLSRYADRVRGADLVLLPGSVSGDASLVEEALGVPAAKASRDAGMLPAVLDHIAEGGELSKVEAAEEYLAGAPKLEARTAFQVSGVPIPARGPPMVLAAEVPAGAREPLGLAERYVAEGARLIVVGHSGDPGYTLEAARLVEAITRLGVPVLAEAPGPEAAEQLLDAGASGLVVSSRTALRLARERGPRGPVVVVGDRDLDALSRAVAVLREAGFHRVVADPVVGVPLVDFAATTLRYWGARSLGVPLWFSAANVATSMWADTHSVYAVLASMAAELGASVFLVVEDQYYTLHAVGEARRALALVEAAWARRRPPAGPGVPGVFAVKQAEPPPPPHLPVEGAEAVPDTVEAKMEKGYFLVAVDHGRGLILVEYREPGRPPRRWAGRRALALARAILSSVAVGPEHAAYLGGELYKAEQALRLGRTYVQDREVVVPPWE